MFFKSFCFGFNPCSGGLWLLRVFWLNLPMLGIEFQSLFWWIMVAKSKNSKRFTVSVTGFNPCSGGLWLLRFFPE